mmetsp:Transcript_21824/g.70332  ORF Transcript_21824/g.70332 Transcript_21824/m.70332 type:complete len:219 (+) Transcript_21824:394-1050(+)
MPRAVSKRAPPSMILANSRMSTRPSPFVSACATTAASSFGPSWMLLAVKTAASSVGSQKPERSLSSFRKAEVIETELAKMILRKLSSALSAALGAIMAGAVASEALGVPDIVAQNSSYETTPSPLASYFAMSAASAGRVTRTPKPRSTSVKSAGVRKPVLLWSSLRKAAVRLEQRSESLVLRSACTSMALCQEAARTGGVREGVHGVRRARLGDDGRS